MKINNFTTLDSEYGKFIVNRHCAFQAEVLIKTGKPHIQPELEKILAIMNTLPECCVVVDAGANIGLVSIPIAQVIAAKGGTVHSFEPQRMMAYALAGSVALNDLENVVVYPQALGATTGRLNGQALDYSTPQDFGLYSLKDQATEQPLNVELRTIDSLNLPQLDFLKIDVEGMEVDVLSGGKKTIAQHQPWCWVEYWQLGVDDIKAQFSGLDYQFYKMDTLNLLCAPTVRIDKTDIKINAKPV